MKSEIHSFAIYVNSLHIGGGGAKCRDPCLHLRSNACEQICFSQSIYLLSSKQ